MNRLTENWGPKKIYVNFSFYFWRSLNCKSLRSNRSPGRKFISLVRGEYSIKVYTGRLRPEVQPPTFCISFNYDRKITSITYLVWNFAYIFNCCSDRMSFKLWINHKSRTLFYYYFFLLFHSHKMYLLTLFGPFFTDRNDRFSYFFIYFS